jgi:hypothetical protein
LRYVTDNPSKVSATTSRLAAECGVGLRDARRTLLTDDLTAFSELSGRGTFPWVIGKGMPHSICPECITASGSDPYWQRLWRIATTTHCPLHKRLLIDRCPGCLAPYGIKLPKSTQLDVCDVCGLEIASVATPGGTDHPPVPRFGGASIAAVSGHRFPVGDVAPREWWKGVCRLLNLVSTPHIAEALLDLDIPDHYAIGLLHLAKAGAGKVRFANRDPAQRARMIGFIEWLLTPWPDRFLSVVPQAARDWSHWLLSAPLPTWLEQLCHAHRPPPIPRQRVLRLRLRVRPVIGGE